MAYPQNPTILFADFGLSDPTNGITRWEGTGDIPNAVSQYGIVWLFFFYLGFPIDWRPHRHGDFDGRLFIGNISNCGFVGIGVGPR